MGKVEDRESIAQLEGQNQIASGAVRQASLINKRYRDAMALLKEKDRELRESLHEQTEMRQQLIEEGKMAALGRLVAGVAHEVNTPVGVAITSNSMIIDACNRLKASYAKDDLSEEGLEEFLETIEESSHIVNQSLQRAAKLIFSFKRISVDQSCDDIRSFNLYEYINDVINTFRNQIKNRPIDITLDCPQKLQVETYPGALSQIMNNLLQNALNYAFEGSKKGNISIHVDLPKKNKVKIIFADNGIGMDEDLRQRAFEPFVSMNRDKGGSGLGLNIVYNLVTQQFGGSIKLESAPGKGTSYSIVFEVG
ncbi:MAG: HAMP domain-containing histidine kinase [Gammaproteobacteria bacterium]|nr:HAMP domain-containing histidine kinase [Gammaproteobacteria bacterium]